MENLGRMGLSEEQADLLEVATKFCREKSPMDKVRMLMSDERGFDAALWREIGALGWLGIAIPERYGGAGLSLAEVTPVVEQMGRTMMASPFFSTTLAARAIIAGGSEAQKKNLLPKIAGGAAATLALMEAGGDWDLANIAATATAHGNQLALSGVKNFVCGAMASEVVIASVLYDDTPRLVVIERAAIPDTALRREIVIDETKRSYALTLDDIMVPSSALFDIDKSRAALNHIQLASALLSAAEMVGGTCACIDYTIGYLTTRKQFGRAIGAYQGLKHPTVDAFIQYEQARSHLYSAAHCFNGQGEIAIRMAKAQADMAFSYAADRSIQFHGGFGFAYECDAQLYRRRAIWHAAVYGDGAYHRKKLADLLL